MKKKDFIKKYKSKFTNVCTINFAEAFITSIIHR